jgi:hypothetical protein
MSRIFNLIATVVAYREIVETARLLMAGSSRLRIYLRHHRS